MSLAIVGVYVNLRKAAIVNSNSTITSLVVHYLNYFTIVSFDTRKLKRCDNHKKTVNVCGKYNKEEGIRITLRMQEM